MKKYGLIMLLYLSCASHAMSQTTINVDEYYKNALENTQKLDAAKSETAETIYASAAETTKKIQEINNKLETVKSQEKPELEALQTLQIELAILHANLQVDALKLQSLAMIKARDTKSKEEMREEEIQKEHKDLEQKLKEKLESSNVRL
ncbi:type IV secretion system protein VirB5 [Bartonella sp. CB169]|uniref:type IV secretion system protein VirB5 n=1 Tax=Bartonella sp. CB169 TaxID=3112257 RepID=UPI00300DFB34